MSKSCIVDTDCPFLYSCIKYGAQFLCQHKGIFPLQAYPIFVYCLMPICSGLVNFTGNSMGIFKVLLLMTMLNYDVLGATDLIQAMVVGTALPNFFSIIFKRHPTQETSLVNYDIVYILIPCSLYGSAIGSLLQAFIPQLLQSVLVVIIFSYFAYRFMLKFKTIVNAAKQKKKLKQSLISDYSSGEAHPPRRGQSRLSVRSHDEHRKKSQMDSLSSRSRYKRYGDRESYSSSISNEQQQHSSIKGQFANNNKIQYRDQGSMKSYEDENLQNEEEKQKQRIEQQKLIAQNKVIVDKIKSYENSLHVKDIFVSFFVFIFFEFFVFLFQGKLPFYKTTKCNYKYFLGLLLLTGLIAVYLFFVRRYQKLKFSRYQQVNYPKDLRLKSKRLFSIVCVGGLSSGIVQSVLGVGSGTCTMTVLLYLNINPRAASATSGYQILFIGTASLLNAFMGDDIVLQDAGFLVGICAILGGMFTIMGYRFFGKFEPIKVNTFLVLLMFVLCIISVVLVIPSIVLSYLDFGWNKLLSIEWNC